jgi:3-deoxy-7-phosphoheptulonate synthase
MIIQIDRNHTNLKTILSTIKGYQYAPQDIVSTQHGNYIVCIGNKDIDIRKIGHLDGVLDVHLVDDAFKLVSSQWKVGKTTIDLGDDVLIGENHFQLMAGPCSIEDESQVSSILDHLEANNIKIMRGGVYKPRSSPYSFRGLGIEGLKMWHDQTRQRGIKIITEVMESNQIEQMYPYIDIFQVGARNSQNFNLLDALGKVDKPVMLKRGISGTIEELLQSAEYIFAQGNEKILLCERGIRSYEKAYRNTMDINAIPILKEKSHLPVIADPSHGIGLRKHVDKIALASVAAGADGVIVEVHPCPEKAASDGQQTLDYKQSKSLFNKIKTMQKALAQ